MEKIVAPLLLVATSAAHITGGNLCNGEQGDFRERLAATVQQLQDLLPSGRSLQDVVDASKDKSVAKAGSRGRCKTAFFQVSGGQSGLDYSKGLLRPWTTERTGLKWPNYPATRKAFLKCERELVELCGLSHASEACFVSIRTRINLSCNRNQRPHPFDGEFWIQMGNPVEES